MVCVCSTLVCGRQPGGWWSTLRTPTPNEDEKQQLAIDNGITVSQVTNWFTNARKRLWQPIVRGEVPVSELYDAIFVSFHTWRVEGGGGGSAC